MSDDDEVENYKVGKGKPPKHTQWKKGMSGNPSGKKKKDETFSDKLRKLLKEEIVLLKNGTPVAMQQVDAMLLALLRKAINTGDTNAFKLILELAEPTGTEGGTSHKSVVSPIDITVLQRHADWVEIVEEARTRQACDAGNNIAGEENSDDN